MINNSSQAEEPSHANAVDKIYRKVTLKIIPFLFVCYVISFLDRINISFAHLQMRSDLNFNDAVYGLAAGAFAIGFCLFEVPSNFLLMRIGAKKTFCRIMVCWGLTSAALMFVQSPLEFYVLRFILGCFEAGFFPGIVLYLTFWYPQARRAGVLSWFFAGVAIAGVVGGLVSGVIIEYMNGLLGLAGWQWMFVIEGLPATFLGIIAYFYLNDKPEDAAWLSSQEKKQISQALRDETNHTANDHSKTASVESIHLFRAALSDRRVWALSFAYFCLACGSFTISFWLPSVIKEAGVKGIMMISLYSAIPYAIGIIGIVGISRHSDKTRERRLHYSICCFIGTLALCGLTLKGLSLPVTLAIVAVAVFFIFACIPVFWTMPTFFLRGRAAAGGIAIISSVGMLGGFVSPYLIGILKVSTGSLSNGIYVMSALLAISGIIILCIFPSPQTSHIKSS